MALQKDAYRRDAENAEETEKLTTENTEKGWRARRITRTGIHRRDAKNAENCKQESLRRKSSPRRTRRKARAGKDKRRNTELTTENTEKSQRARGKAKAGEHGGGESARLVVEASGRRGEARVCGRTASRGGGVVPVGGEDHDVEARLVKFLHRVEVAGSFHLAQITTHPQDAAIAHGMLGNVEGGSREMRRAVGTHRIGRVGIPAGQAALHLNGAKHAGDAQRLVKARVVLAAELVEEKLAPGAQVAIFAGNIVKVIVGHALGDVDEKALGAKLLDHGEIAQTSEMELIGALVLDGLRGIGGDEGGVVRAPAAPAEGRDEQEQQRNAGHG